MKYVMFGTTTGRKFAVIFPDHLVHAHVAKYIANLSFAAHNEPATAVSGGFIALGDEVKVMGESESLKLKSTEVDALRIMIGESVSSMPDEMLKPLWKKVEDAKQGVPSHTDFLRTFGEYAKRMGEAWRLDNLDIMDAYQVETEHRYTIGKLTTLNVFQAAGLKNLSDIQAVLDQVEKALEQLSERAAKARKHAEGSMTLSAEERETIRALRAGTAGVVPK